MRKIDYDNLISRSVFKSPPSGIRRFFDIANQIEGCISLGVGEPDFVTDWGIREAAIKSLIDGQTCYTSNSGMIELRELICRYYTERYSVNYTPEQCLVTVGASEGIDLAMRVLCDPGDEIIVPAPSYASYCPTVRFTGGVPIPLRLYAENGFKLTAEAIAEVITPRTKAIIIPYPNNPTGGVMTREELIAALKPIQDTDIILIADEIYSELRYDGIINPAIASIPGMYDRTITISGFSKSFAMTGWRLGYVMAPQPLLDQILKVHQLTLMCANITSQYAGIAALEQGFETNFASLAKMHREYNRRRRFLVSSLNEIGLKCHEPMGAFYVFPSIASTGMTSDEFCERLLLSQKVAVIPGSAFGPLGNEFIRISYAYSMDHLKQAMNRIKAFMQELS